MNNKPDIAVIYWLASGCFLIMTMVIIGGITRLTHSGLSMVQWNLLMGSIPPLNQEEWEKVFELYRQTPEFMLKNYHFSLQEFKSIFWWEYIHRMIGRITGLVFIIPFIYFLVNKRFEAQFIKKLLIVFSLGAFQGFMGWFMVKSGLVKDPNVSHYRLAAHLIIAFLLYNYIFWLILEKIYGVSKPDPSLKKLRYITVVFLGILTLQIVYGAFVSGLKAGFIYTTFPKMGDVWIAESVPFVLAKDGLISLLQNPASVQFMHRCIALVIVLTLIILWIQSRKIISTNNQKGAINILIITTLSQVLLGVFTLIFSVPVSLGVLHQFGALILLTSGIYFLYRLSNSNIDSE